jgi:hypothetical protein
MPRPCSPFIARTGVAVPECQKAYKVKLENVIDSNTGSELFDARYKNKVLRLESMWSQSPRW